VLVRDFAALQFASFGLYISAATLAHFARIWRDLPLVGSFLPFAVAQGLFVFGAEVVLIMYLFLSWYRSNLHVYPDHLELTGGVVRARSVRIPYGSGSDIRVSQNPLGRLTRYGTVCIVHDGRRSVVRHVPEPEQFVHAMRGVVNAVRPPDEAQAVLAATEDEMLEFKSSLRWDVRTGKVNRVLEKSTMKTIAAFLNSRGGHVVLGVTDGRSVRGLEDDIATLQRKDRDGFELHVGNLFNGMLGAHVRHLLQVRWFEYAGKYFCVLTVAPSLEPIYLKSEHAEEFFVRTGNASTALSVSQVSAYLKSRFGH
jgi:hypothetical protein